MSTSTLASVSDDELLRRLAHLLLQSRRLEADLVAHIGEVDARRLYAREASPSMFAYCTQALHLSEAEAYLRITVARAAREHGDLLVLLADGRLHLTGIAKLAPRLTPQNREALLGRAIHKTKRQIEELLAEMHPQPDIPSAMRKLPERKATVSPPLDAAALGTALGELRQDQTRTGFIELRPDRVPCSRPMPAQRPVIQPLSPDRFKVQFTAGAVLRDKLERLQALMRPTFPDGDLASIIEQAVTEKLERLEARRFGRTSTPRQELTTTDIRPSSTHIPAAIRRAVHARDQGHCRFVDAQGRRCSQQGRLEYHHRHPFGMGGDHRLANISLLCHAHNQYQAQHDYGGEGLKRSRPVRA